MSHIHPTAVVDATAEIAPDARIGPYCIIGPEVRIGAGTVLHNHVTVQAFTTIGEHNTIYPYAVLGADPQDRKYRGERTWCEIGHRNSIREHVTIHRGTGNGGGVTRIGNDNLLMVAAHVAHDCIVGDEVILANQVMLAGHVRIERGATISGGAGLHHFTTVGTCAFVAGLASVTRDVPPFMLVEGNPAEVRKFNEIAMKRRGFSQAHIDAVKDAYKRLYRENGAPMARKIVDLTREYASIPAVVHLCEALRASSAGVHGRALEIFRHDDKRAPAPVAAVHA